MFRNQVGYWAGFGVAAVLLVAPGCRHKYDNPITKDTQQPDKVLFDTAVDDIEHGRFERARLTLQTMMNTYDTSEYLAKAKLAMADSWKREGGAHGMAQAEAEYKDFILFYPQMEESAEAQFKICQMQYDQMDKPDRDPYHAKLTNVECQTVIKQYPNSQYASQAADMDRQAQEVLAQSEFQVGLQYWKRGGNGYYSSANRFTNLVNSYPLYSGADEALWLAADDYNQMGDKYENQQADMYSRIVKDYPLSVHAEDAKAQLKALGRAVPDADPVAEARMKFELENRTKRTLGEKLMGAVGSRPNTANAAKSGNPSTEEFKPTVPLDVPAKALGGATTNEVTIGPANQTQDILDKAPDARAAGSSDSSTAASGTAATDKPAGDKPAADAAAKPAASAAPATNANNPTPVANAKGKPPKPPKPVAPKKRPKPADQKNKKGTAAPATNSTSPLSPASAPAQASGKTNGGGAPQLPRP